MVFFEVEVENLGSRSEKDVFQPVIGFLKVQWFGLIPVK